MTRKPQSPMQFGPFHLDAAERQLTVGGEPIPLRDKAFETLLLLVTRPGQLVTREEIFAAVWPDTIVEESNIAHNISLLRRTLAAHTDEPCIATVPRRGYRFVCPVRCAAPDAPAGDPELVGAARRQFAAGDLVAAYRSLRAASEAVNLSAADWAMLAEAALWGGHYDQQIPALERAIDGFEAAGDERGAARCWLQIGVAYIQQGRATLAQNALLRARTAARGLSGDPVQTQLDWLAARVSWTERDWPRSRALAERTLAAGEASGCGDTVALAAMDVAHCLLAEHHFEGLRPALERVEAELSRPGLSRWVLNVVFCGLIFAWRSYGEWARARDWNDVLERWWERNGSTWHPGICRVHRGELSRLCGDLAAAEADLARGCAQLEVSGSYLAGFGYRELGEVRLRRGDFAGAEEAFCRALEQGVQPQPGMAYMHFLKGDIDRAWAEVRTLVDAQEQGEGAWLDRIHTAYSLPLYVEVACARGDLRAAAWGADRLAGIAASTGAAAQCAAAAAAAGQLCLVRGAPGDAIPHLRSACAHWSRAQAPYECSQARRHLAEALRQIGDHEGARLELETAAQGLQRIGAQHGLQRVRADLGRCDATRPRVEARVEVAQAEELRRLLGADAWQDLRHWLGAQLLDRAEPTALAGSGDSAWLRRFGDEATARTWMVELEERMTQHRKVHGFAPELRMTLRAVADGRVATG